MQLSPPLSANVPAARFSAGRALAILQQLLEGQSYPAGSPANRVLRERITTRLLGMGYIVETEHSVSCTRISPHTNQRAPVYNILLARLPTRWS